MTSLQRWSSATVEALKSGTEVLHQDFGKHPTDFLTVPFVYRADRPQWNRKGLVCVWSINQKFVKHKVAPNEGSMRHHLCVNGWPQFSWSPDSCSLEAWMKHGAKKPGKCFRGLEKCLWCPKDDGAKESRTILLSYLFLLNSMCC